MLKALHGTINANKEPIKSVTDQIDNYSLLDPIDFHLRDSISEYCRVLLDLISNHLEHPSNYLVLKRTKGTV